jgi:transposase InsO family protein
MEATSTLSETVGVQAACSALGLPRATYYRHQHAEPERERERPRPPLALAPEERQAVLEVLHAPGFVDRSPHQIWAVLLDEAQQHLCSVRTMYRILEGEGEVRERRNQLRRPAYAKPELVATAPNQVWTWDITKLKGPAKWSYFYLYVILDLYSRYVTGWMVARRESGTLAQRLIVEAMGKQGICRDQLTVHADRGPSMTKKTLALLLADLGVRKTHSRPYTSNDNPFSEAQFKTLKYHPSFPDRFGSLEDVRGFCGPFLTWYNTDHRHSSLALLTPADVHYGRAEQILEQRAGVLRAAFEANPQRFKGRVPSPGVLPEAVWINPPKATP